MKVWLRVIFRNLPLVMAACFACGLLSCRNSGMKARLARLDSVAYENPLLASRMTDSILSCDNSWSRDDRMRLMLIKMKANNSADLPLNDSILNELITYFDRNGNANERMAAYYVKGCSCAKQGDAPSAMENYERAAALADTTADDCDYRFLHRVHGQSSRVLYKNHAYQNAVHENRLAIWYAWKANDPLYALIYEEQMANFTYYMGKMDSSIMIRERLYPRYLKYGYPKNAATSVGALTYLYVEKKDFGRARKYLDIYETGSGVVDSLGNVVAGKEFHYITKAKFYQGICKLDSAILFFKKGLRSCDDVGDELLCAKGLAEVYGKLNVTDSVLKYSARAIELQDAYMSSFKTEQTLQAQFSLKYGNMKESAEREKSKFYFTALVGVVGVVVLFIISLVIYYVSRRKQLRQKRTIQKYKGLTDQLLKAEDELRVLLEEEQGRYLKLTSQKELEVQQLREEVEVYKRLLPMRYSESLHMQELFVEKVKEKIRKGAIPLTNEDIQRLIYVFQDDTEIKSLGTCVNDGEYVICLLVKLGLTPSDICLLTGRSLSDIANIRKRLYKKLTGKDGSSKDFDMYIRGL